VAQYGMTLDEDDIENDGQINYGIFTFKNIGTSLLTEFQTMTGDNWAANNYNLMDVEVPWLVCIYFILMIVVNTFFLLNIVIAVILDSFTKV